MTDEKRPQEIHVASLSRVERDALPLLAGMVYGDLYTPETLNMRGLGIYRPGIYCGFIPEPKTGLTLKIRRDGSLGYGAAMCMVGLQQFHIVQQHDIDVELITGYDWAIVLEAFYHPQKITTQVDYKSDLDACTLKAVKVEDLSPNQIIICEVDLTGGELLLTEELIDKGRRKESHLTIAQHTDEENPHAQYLLITDFVERVQKEVSGLVTDKLEKDNDAPVSSGAVAEALASKAAGDHGHSGDQISEATEKELGVVKVTSKSDSASEDHVMTGKAVSEAVATRAASEHSHNAEDLPNATEKSAGIIRITHSTTSDAEGLVMSAKAVQERVGEKADADHSHDANTLPAANTKNAGIVKVTNAVKSTEETTVPTSNAVYLGLKDKADKTKVIKDNDNVTLSRGGQKTVLIRDTSNSGAITLKMDTFLAGDELVILATNQSAGSITLLADEGTITDDNGGTDNRVVVSGKGRLSLICTDEGTSMLVVEKHFS